MKFEYGINVLNPCSVSVIIDKAEGTIKVIENICRSGIKEKKEEPFIP